MAVLRIAVCEDQAAEMDQLIREIEKSLTAQSRAFDVCRFHSGGAFLSGYCPGKFDVLFLDMFLGDMLGLEIARRIRSRGDDCPLVFVTQSPDYALESYGVHATHYLLKPVEAFSLDEVWRRCLAPQHPSESCITLMIDRKPRDIPLSDILFVEADNKRCLLHLPGETLSTRVPIDQLEYMVSSPAFCRCHRGYLVNLRHVERMEKDFIMRNGDLVYIRQCDLAEIRRRFCQYRLDNPVDPADEHPKEI